MPVADVVLGRVAWQVPFRPEFVRQQGRLHAGKVTTVPDSVCGFAAFTPTGADAVALAVPFKSNFPAPAKAGLFRFKGMSSDRAAYSP